jgi:hypothetical protein
MLTSVKKAGERGAGGGQNIWGPECSEGPGNLDKMFVYCLSSAISRATGARVHKLSFCPGACSWLLAGLECKQQVTELLLHIFTIKF